MIRKTTVLILLCLSFICPVRADDDALPIIQKAFEAAKANEAIARRYVYRERILERRFNKKGKVKKQESTTYDVTLLDTSEYRRLVAVNDKPLFKETEAKEQRKLEKQIKKMRNETPKHRRKRLAKVEKGRQEGEKFLEEVTKAFDFKLTGEEQVDGTATYVISAEPKPGYKPFSRETKVLPKVRGTLWISKQDHAWVKADMETLDNITWALVFKLRKGANMRFKQRRVNDEVWLTESWYIRIKARAALVFKFNGEVIGSYSDYQRFTTDSTIDQMGEVR